MRIDPEVVSGPQAKGKPRSKKGAANRPFPAKYADEGTSDLTVTVKPKTTLWSRSSLFRARHRQSPPPKLEKDWTGETEPGDYYAGNIVGQAFQPNVYGKSGWKA